MNWNQLLSTKRFGLEAYHEKRDDDRSEFQRDYDRLIFSAPFRRLQKQDTGFPASGKCVCAQPTYSQSGGSMCRTFVGGKCGS